VSWFQAAASAPFGVSELPYGVFSRHGAPPRVGVAVGDQVIDLPALLRATGRDPSVFEQPSLNRFLAQGRPAWAETRSVLQTGLEDPAGRALIDPHLIPLSDVQLHRPIEVADFVDFYASEHHATNLGRIFRPGGDPLTPNWKHMPIGYHGRAGTVVVSGTDVVRPVGQLKTPSDPTPSFGPTRKLDFEAELGWVVGVGSAQGVPVPVQEFRKHVFGVVVLNDWSARDIQAWEYVPLGPFLGKSFATSISAWVLPLEALDDAQVELPNQDPELLPYLATAGRGYDIEIQVEINGQIVSSCPYAAMYYSPAQMIAHLTVNGAHLRTGDLYGSGTVSGPAADQCGSLMELSWNGTRSVDLGTSGSRTFLEDGDEVVLRATSAGPSKAQLGEVRGAVRPAPSPPG
jgi:fumarylacetoacetase